MVVTENPDDKKTKRQQHIEKNIQANSKNEQIHWYKREKKEAKCSTASGKII